jgi:hypothetical protein
MIENETVYIGTTKRLVGTATLIKIFYPMFNSRNITLAINTQNMPYMKLGRKRYFNLPDIEKWIDENQQLRLKERQYKY